jgi:hypothetical protein
MPKHTNFYAESTVFFRNLRVARDRIRAFECERELLVAMHHLDNLATHGFRDLEIR